LLFGHGVNVETVSDFIDTLFTLLDKEVGTQCALPIEDVASVMCTYQRMLTDVETCEEILPEVCRYDEEVARDCVELLRRELREGVLGTYAESGKCSESECAMYEQAAARLCGDMLDDDMREVYEYFRELNPDVPHAEYRSGHRHRFEYVMDVAKKRFSRILKKYFS